ncbi:amino acid/amide ABC transporter ATP-binding protein 1 (HAAT family) [Rhodococcus wratislaviensis]|uniref:ABC transporter ATP-binding protein n=2 Tax=Rhodococcus TaxID=1827 RepID=A0AB38F6I9_RHOWR|nr:MULTISPECIES: ABC transporter ATP-binding protein [Rhodococcus]AII03568.1 leucine/isoleucine/valine transporter ATP-binding subunit [Rhodococcus opacus]REE70889.1 amino acid/amide ABC transporter ATP-binding protein 1 (HAAT family) [Rhodococcus wratislaviensis]WAM14989.1 ABC transporter ATP-binding protein [Rhodococcus sp. JS3073]SPZ34625.1 ABC transporter ATP-binding protein [Rhodococcus wratislaviensis]
MSAGPPDVPALQVSDVRLRFGGVVALDGPSFTIEPGQIVGLIGPNGAGKTTLFNCISRLYQPDSGQITFGSTDLLALSADAVADAGIARTFQNIGLFPTLSVLDNILTGAYSRTRAGFLATALGLPRTRREEADEQQEAWALLESMNLEHVGRELAGNLPYGTLKRVELARALMQRPRLLMLDEPANGLIHEEVLELADTVRRLRDERGFSVLLVEHHMAMVMSISDRVVVLNFGQKVTEGEPAEVAAHPEVIEAYLGGAA